MPDKSAIPAIPLSAPGAQPSTERDTLQAIDHLFLHDQLEALLASPALAQAGPGSVADDGPVQESAKARDTEPSLDTVLLRAALGAKSK